MTLPLDASVAERAAYLREGVVWAALSEPVLHATAAAMQPAAYEQGSLIIRHGEPGRQLHVLTKGAAEVRVHAANGTVIPVATMSVGACFGEMSMLSGDVTSADVVAASDCETLTLDRPAFEALVASQPQLLREFVRMVARRLTDSNLAMGAAQEKEKGLTRFLQEASNDHAGELIGKLGATRALQRQVEAQAQRDGALLIQGERGTGKELVARLVHFRSARSAAPLLRTDCAQIAETPWGDKLFGDYRRAPDEQGPAPVSYLDLARGGTIVLKNVELLPHAIQKRLAGFIEQQAQLARPAADSVRIIATCRTDFQELASTGKVSAALAQMLGGDVIFLPPLRDRKRDIPDLARHFVTKHAGRLNKQVPTLDDESIRRLVTYDYLQGNVSELEEAIRRAVILTDGDRIDSHAIFLGQPPPPARWAWNLLAFRRSDLRRTLRLSLGTTRVVVAAVFAFILLECLFGARLPGNPGTILVWSVGWPLLVLSFSVGARACCAVCPVCSAAESAQRLFNLKWRVPAWVKRHGIWIAMAGFFVIVWTEEATAMRQSPAATALLLVSVSAGAVATSMLLPRRAWCRYLCPLGGFAGLGAMTGLVELRPTPDICAAKCTDHSCFKGDGRVDGCPMFNHVMFVDSNQHCVLCLKCLDTCPNDSPQLNLRLPARDLLTTSDWSNAGRWTVLLAGLLVAMALLQHWERQAGGLVAQVLAQHRFLSVTAMLAMGGLVPQAVLHLVTRESDASADSALEAMWRKIAAWAPVVIAGFVSYQLAFVPALSGVTVTMGIGLPDGAGGRGTSVLLLSVMQAGILCAGLLVALAVAWNVGRAASNGQRQAWWRALGVALAVGVAYWSLLLALLVS